MRPRYLAEVFCPLTFPWRKRAPSLPFLRGKVAKSFLDQTFSISSQSFGGCGLPKLVHSLIMEIRSVILRYTLHSNGAVRASKSSIQWRDTGHGAGRAGTNPCSAYARLAQNQMWTFPKTQKPHTCCFVADFSWCHSFARVLSYFPGLTFFR